MFRRLGRCQLHGEEMTFLEQFRLYFPELSAATDDRVEFFFGLAQKSMDAKYWKGQYDEGILNLVAHMIVMRFGKTGKGEPVTAVPQTATSKTIGKLSKGMESKNSGIYANAGDYALTPYGRRYWELLELIKPSLYLVSSAGSYGCGSGTFSR